MRALVVPVVLALFGLAAGIGAAIVTAPEREADEAAPPEVPATPRDYVRLSNQFVVPIVEGGRVASLVILSLGVEVAAGSSETVYAREPKLRDAFLQVLFAHANAGGFRGSFTEAGALSALRQALREAAVSVLGPMASDVLIADMVRQDS
jgi:flagellar basal body-associated protein FliL